MCLPQPIFFPKGQALLTQPVCPARPVQTSTSRHLRRALPLAMTEATSLPVNGEQGDSLEGGFFVRVLGQI